MCATTKLLYVCSYKGGTDSRSKVLTDSFIFKIVNIRGFSLSECFLVSFSLFYAPSMQHERSKWKRDDTNDLVCLFLQLKTIK